MTETSPVGLVNFTKHDVKDIDERASFALKAKQGVPLPFFEIRTVADGTALPHDGTGVGELQVRGPWVASRYHDLAETNEQWTADGWFRTGDVGTIDANGYVAITDRIKDLIKSGGEWISSLQLENALLSHPAVKEAAVIGVAHPKWGERPLGVVVLEDGMSASAVNLNDHLAPNFAAYALPDAYVFVAEIPRTSTGKMMKAKLRETYKTWRWT
jgi:fatty-acyl-CoA synthase